MTNEMKDEKNRGDYPGESRFRLVSSKDWQYAGVYIFHSNGQKQLEFRGQTRRGPFTKVN